MTMMNEQRKRQQQQLIQQIRDHARNGQWEEAKRLADSLPDTPDNTKMKERIKKQLFIATGEVPTVMEGGMALLDSELDEALLEGVPIARKPDRKPTNQNPLNINIVNVALYITSVLILLWGLVTFSEALSVPGQYLLYNASAPQITQVYAEATFVMVKAIAMFALVGVLQLAALVRKIK